MRRSSFIAASLVYLLCIAGMMRAAATSELRQNTMPYVATSSCGHPNADVCGVDIHGNLNVVFPNGTTAHAPYGVKVFFIR